MKFTMQLNLEVDGGRARRAAILGAVHLAVWASTLAIALWAMGASAPTLSGRTLALLALLFVSVKGAGALWSGSFRQLWRHAGVEDLAAQLRTSLLTTSILATCLHFVTVIALSPLVAVIDGALSLVVLSSLRVVPNVALEMMRWSRNRRGRGIILAGRRSLVDLELRRMRSRISTDRVVGLALDGPSMSGALLRQVPVLSRKEIEELLASKEAEAVMIVPPAPPDFAADLEQLCAKYGVACHSVASLQALGDVIHNATAELIDRPVASLDSQSLADFIAGKRILVTGGGGSIGSELSRQVARYKPTALCCLDRSENAIFQAESKLDARKLPFPVDFRVCDVRDEAAINRLFAEFKPQVVLHAAAHKHVPIMERHPAEAVLNNVQGTRIVADAAAANGVETFVFVSTDKAVRPTSVMGATKRLGELYVKGMTQVSSTRYVAVRFGNVLGSSGSVVPIFVDQIKRGGPVTVTHPEMSRYFMSIPEACHLVLKAAALGTGGEVFVLDMGAPVKIVDLARRLIERAGLRPGDDVPIVFSGMRPGEKLHEQLVLAEEVSTRTKVPGIRVVASEELPRKRLAQLLDDLAQRARTGDNEAVVRMMAEILTREYTPSLSKTSKPRLEAVPAREAAG